MTMVLLLLLLLISALFTAADVQISHSASLSAHFSS